MKASLALSVVKIPHKGSFVDCKSVHSIPYTVNRVGYVHLEIQREGGPYIVLRMDLEAAREIAEDLLRQLEAFKNGVKNES